MSLFNAQDKQLQAAAFKAGIRTAEQTLEAGLGVGVVGGIVVTASDGNAFTIDWKMLLGAVLFLLLASFFAGLKSFISISSNGLPAQYTSAAASSTALTTATATAKAAGSVIAPAANALARLSSVTVYNPSDDVTPLTPETAAQEPEA